MSSPRRPTRPTSGPSRSSSRTWSTCSLPPCGAQRRAVAAMPEPLTPDRLAAIRGRDQQALKRAEDPICPLDQAEYDRTLLLDEVDRLKQAEKRHALARDALLKDGYFTPDQVGPYIAPRITERVSSLRAEVERLSSLSRLATD